jgi:hypothetical protein
MDKYIVFKREDFEAGIQEIAATFQHGGFVARRELGKPLADAIVLRKQDSFAAGALHAYANQVVAAMEILQMLPPTQELTDRLNRLQEIADFFHEQAVDAENLRYKLPD